MLGLTCLHAQTQTGKATFYSRRATGARTASGERLHHDSLTCAHRTYPFGTLLKVTNLSNGREVVVRVTDRGPYGRGRIIDLSYGAAEELGMLAQGVSTVRVEKVGEGTQIPFKPNERIEMPEIDFEVTDAGYSIIDEWADRADEPKAPSRSSTQKKKGATTPKAENTSDTPKNAQQHSKTVAQHEKAAPANTPAVPKKETNKWKNVFDKLKDWKEDLF